MGDTRPIPERLGDQHDQAQHLVRTGNGPTVEDEPELLAEVYGRPDMAGFYTGPELAAAEVADQDDEAAAEPADSTSGEAAPAEDGDASA